MQAILLLKDLSVIKKGEKNRTKKIAQKLAADVDLEEVFKEPIKKKDDQDSL